MSSPLLHLSCVSLFLGDGPSFGRIADLDIYEGEVVVRLRRFPIGPLTQEESHHFGPVQINQCFFPPWYNTGVLLRTQGKVISVGMNVFRRRALKAALTEAGIPFTVARRSYMTLFRP